MNYLIEFNDHLISGKIKIHEHYVDKSDNHTTHDNHDDVVTDIMENNKPYSVACLPIAKQIIVFEKNINIKIPKIGDLFVGLIHLPVIDKITFSVSNYTDEFVLDGRLVTICDIKMWVITELPLCLLPISDYDNVNISAVIHINDTYNLQTDNQEVFKICYGYFNTEIGRIIMDTPVYQIPIDVNSYIELVCGIWTIKEKPYKNI